MNKLEEKIKELDFTMEEWSTFRKVEKCLHLEDLQYILQERELDENQLEIIYEKLDLVLEKFDDYMGEGNNWRDAMNFAIDYVLED